MNKKLEAWPGKCSTSVKGAHRALCCMYDGLETDTNFQGFKGDGLGLDEGLSIQRAAQIFRNHCRELILLLSSPTEGRVWLPLGSVFQLVARCVRVTFPEVKSVPSLKELAEVLPSVQQTALDVLAYLILCCGTNLLPKSKSILDICLQTLASTQAMEGETRSETRAHVYRVLSLWLEVAGLGSYFLRRVKDLSRELISDICWERKTTQPPNGRITTGGSEPNSQRKKGKGKKKGASRRAESYLNSDYADSTAKGEGHPDVPENVPATLGALTVSRLVAERGQFSPFQNLMHSLADTISAIRLPPPNLSPYVVEECRSGLYNAAFVFSSLPLEACANSANTVAHFKLTSQLLSGVLHGGYTDPSRKVQRLCQSLISSSRSIGSINRPIVRKVLPDDQVEIRDVGMMDRQMDEIKEENERLKQKLVEAEIEIQRQSLIPSKILKGANDLKEMMKISEEETKEYQRLLENVQAAPEEDNDDETSGEEGSNEEEAQMEVSKEQLLKEEPKTTKKNDVSKNNTKAVTKLGIGLSIAEKTSAQDLSSIPVKEREQGNSKKSKNKGKKKGKATTDHEASSRGEGGSHALLGKERDLSSSSQEKKRPLTDPDDMSGQSEKKSRMDGLDEAVVDEDVQDMIADFVDASPDSD